MSFNESLLAGYGAAERMAKDAARVIGSVSSEVDVTRPLSLVPEHCQVLASVAGSLLIRAIAALITDFGVFTGNFFKLRLRNADD